MISRRHMYLVLTLLMPLLTLRALLPAGYMVSAAGDGPRIVLCSEGLAALNAPDDSRHDQLPAAADDCPFALSTMHAPPPHVVVRSFAPALEIQFLSQSAAGLPSSTGPPRQYSARAPPATFL